MNKYDRMLEVNKQASEAKIEKARREIVRMVDDGENVSIQKLMQRTGLSRGFFNKNPQVRKGLTVPWNRKEPTVNLCVSGNRRKAGRYNKYVITCFCLPIHTFHQELVLKIYHVQSGYIRLLAEFVDILYGEQADPLLILLK